MFHLGNEKCLKSPVTPNHQLQVPNWEKCCFPSGGGRHHSYNSYKIFTNQAPCSYCCQHHCHCFQEQFPTCPELLQKEAVFWYGSFMQTGILPEAKGPFLCLLCWFASSLPLPLYYLCFLLLSPFCFLSRVHHWVPAVTRYWVRNTVDFLSFSHENHPQGGAKFLSV